MKNFDANLFFEKSVEMLCVANAEGYFTKINPRWSEVLGYSDEELMSKPFLEFVHPEDVEETVREAAKLHSGTYTSINFENRYKKADGNYIWMGWNATLVGENIYAAARDITELRMQKLYFDEMQEAAKVGYWRIDLKTNTPVWSDKTYDIHEIPRGEKIDLSNAMSFYPDEAGELIQRRVQEGMTTGKPWDEELPFITAKGNRIWVRAVGIPVMSKGEVVDLYGVFQDITERKESELKLKYVLENTGDGFWDWQIQEDYEYMSPRFWEILGYEAEEKRHHPDEWKRLILEEDLKLALKKFDRHVQSKGQEPFWLQARYRHKNGSIVWVICSGKVIEWDTQGQPIRMIGSHTDITELKKIQSQLVGNAKLASLGTMAGGIAHEINNPLAIISARTRLIQKTILSDKETDNNKILRGLNIINETVERIASIVDGMRSLMGGKKSDKFEDQSYKSLVNGSISMCREKMKSRGIELKYQETEIEAHICCNSTQVSQVIINLIGNSIDAVEDAENPWIQIDATQSGENLVFKVSDSGGPLGRDVIDKIFDPFFTTKETGKGTGLGLSISQEIARGHGGKLYYDHNSPTTCFVLELPKVAKKATA